MTSGRRRAVVLWLLTAFALVLLFGRHFFDDDFGVIVMIGTFAVGFACLHLVVAPWAMARPRPRR